MKRIIEKCNLACEGRSMEEPVKLRLRGRGSGYREGQNNQGNIRCNEESEEPLHLCISSKYYEKYKNACILVQELIINIYEEYKRFCERNGKVPVVALNVKRVEGVTSRQEIKREGHCFGIEESN